MSILGAILSQSWKNASECSHTWPEIGLLWLFSTFVSTNGAYYLNNSIFPLFFSFPKTRHIKIQLHEKKMWLYSLLFSLCDLKVASLVLRARIQFLFFLCLKLNSCSAFIMTTTIFTYMSKKWMICKENYPWRSF